MHKYINNKYYANFPYINYYTTLSRTYAVTNLVARGL